MAMQLRLSAKNVAMPAAFKSKKTGMEIHSGPLFYL